MSFQNKSESHTETKYRCYVFCPDSKLLNKTFYNRKGLDLYFLNLPISQTFLFWNLVLTSDKWPESPPLPWATTNKKLLWAFNTQKYISTNVLLILFYSVECLLYRNFRLFVHQCCLSWNIKSTSTAYFRAWLYFDIGSEN